MTWQTAGSGQREGQCSAEGVRVRGKGLQSRRPLMHGLQPAGKQASRRRSTHQRDGLDRGQQSAGQRGGGLHGGDTLPCPGAVGRALGAQPLKLQRLQPGGEAKASGAGSEQILTRCNTSKKRPPAPSTFCMSALLISVRSACAATVAAMLTRLASWAPLYPLQKQGEGRGRGSRSPGIQGYERALNSATTSAIAVSPPPAHTHKHNQPAPRSLGLKGKLRQVDIVAVAPLGQVHLRRRSAAGSTLKSAPSSPQPPMRHCLCPLTCMISMRPL